MVHSAVAAAPAPAAVAGPAPAAVAKTVYFLVSASPPALPAAVDTAGSHYQEVTPLEASAAKIAPSVSPAPLAVVAVAVAVAMAVAPLAVAPLAAGQFRMVRIPLVEASNEHCTIGQHRQNRQRRHNRQHRHLNLQHHCLRSNHDCQHCPCLAESLLLVQAAAKIVSLRTFVDDSVWLEKKKVYGTEESGFVANEAKESKEAKA